MSEEARPGRELMRRVDAGVFSTHSAALEGYPFGSLTPFVLSITARPVLLISAIAQHTRNVANRPQSCLTVYDVGAVGDKQAHGRVSVVGDALRVPDDHLDEVSERYFRVFPASRGHEKVHDFAFYWIDPVRVRYIGGFGEIYWIERDDWLLGDPAWQSGQDEVMRHMNEDHADSMIQMCRHFAGREVARAELVAVDPEGFHVRGDDEIVYVKFANRCDTLDDLHSALVGASKIARGAT